MKQKNLILVAVAVGCGLVAAFLTSQIGAKPSNSEQVEVPVAAKDLTVGTKLSKDELKKLVTYKKFNKDALPSAYAAAEDELADKRLIRTVRAGEPFNPQDLTTNAPISPPPGFNMMSFNVTPEKIAGGFAGPGSRVDVLASLRLQKENKTASFPLFIDMLVLAVNTDTQYGQQGAFANAGNVSVAVTPKQALLLHAALNRGADLRLVLRNPDNPPVWDKILTEQQIWALLRDDPKGSGPNGDDPGTEDPSATQKKDVVKLPVATEDLPAGTQLTPELIQNKFKDVEITPPAPGNIVQDLREHTGKYLTKDLAANQYVPRSFLGDKPGKPGPTEGSTQKEPLKVPPVLPKEKPVYWDTTVQTSNGIKKYRFQLMKGGEYKYVGEVKEDGTVVPGKNPNIPHPPSPPASEPA